jgi:hypothetical protein
MLIRSGDHGAHLPLLRLPRGRAREAVAERPCHVRLLREGALRMSDLITTRQVAERLGVTPGRVLQMARERVILPQHRAVTLLWREEDFPRFARRPRGRPPKGGHACRS